jgi:hypothetical protein
MEIVGLFLLAIQLKIITFAHRYRAYCIAWLNKKVNISLSIARLLYLSGRAPYKNLKTIIIL